MPPKMYQEVLVNMPQASEGGVMPPVMPAVVTTQPAAGATALVEASCFTEVDDKQVVDERSCEYDGKDMTAIIKLLDFLHSRLKAVSLIICLLLVFCAENFI